jgi:glycosyltransferase involved in cell wall biosynthesis
VSNEGKKALRVVYVYYNSHRERAEQVAAGTGPDSTMHGVNHLHAFGIDARVHDPLLSRRSYRSSFISRAAWNVREILLPWEVRDCDVAVTPLGALFPLAGRSRPRLRIVVLNYGLGLIYDRSSPARRRLLKASLRSAATVICLGRSQAEHAIERIGVDPRRVHAMIIGVDERFFDARPPTIPPSEPYVLTVGKDLSRDFATFAHAVSSLGIRSEIVAQPRNLTGLTFPARSRVSQPSFLDLRELYAGAAAVVLPQRHDGYPYGSEAGGLTTLLEGMAMAKPMIVSDRAVLRDYISKGENALIVPPENPAALREALERVLADEQLASTLGARARATIETRHAMRDFTQRLVPVLHEAAERE